MNAEYHSLCLIIRIIKTTITQITKYSYLPTFENKKSYSHVCEAHITSAKSLAAGVQGPLKGPGSSRVVEALWCYLSLIFYHMTTLNELHFNDKNHAYFA